MTGHFLYRRREFITLLGGARRRGRSRRARSSASACGASAYSCPRRRTIRNATRIGAFLQGLQQLGWTHRPQRADRISLGHRQCRRIRRHAAELVALAPDVILANGAVDRGAVAAGDPHRADRVRDVIDPVGAGFVESLARPGGNATGFILFEYSMSGKWLELLKEIAPSVTRVAVLRDPAYPTGTGQFGAIQTAAPSLGVEVQPDQCARRRRDRARRSRPSRARPTAA